MKSNLPSTANRRASKLNVASFVMALAYIFFSYTANEFLLPARIHSLAMYGFLACVVAALVRNATSVERVGRDGTETVRVRFVGNFAVTGYTKWYCLFFLFSASSLAWTRNWSLNVLYSMMVTTLITYSFTNVLNSGKRLKACCATFVFAAVVAGLALALTGRFSHIEGRLGHGEEMNANTFSALFGTAGVFAVWFSVFENIKQRRIYAASFVFIAFVMALSGGRKLLIGLMCVSFYFFLAKGKWRFLNNISAVLKILTLLFVFWTAIMNTPMLYEAIGQRFEALIHMTEGGGSDVNSDNTRAAMIRLGLDGWFESPIWGHGVDAFKYRNRETLGHFYYAHNNYVELLFDLGVVGFALYYGFVALIFRRLTARMRRPEREWAILGIGLLLFTLVFDCGGVGYYDVLIQILFTFAYLCAAQTEAAFGGLPTVVWYKNAR